MTIFSWVLDSGGSGRGAWQGGVLYEFMQWARVQNCFPRIAMGASAGGFAAADISTGTHETIMKGWTRWGIEEIPDRAKERGQFRSMGGLSRFRSHLHHSIRYVMEEKEMRGVFDSDPETRTRLLVFTTRARPRGNRPFDSRDSLRYFLKSSTRKLPRPFKYMPSGYSEDPVIFATDLPDSCSGEFVRPLTRANFHHVIEASCLIPFAMGQPIPSDEVLPFPREMDLQTRGSVSDVGRDGSTAIHEMFPGDIRAAFLDGGFSLKMPFRLLAEDARFAGISELIQCDKTIVFCCDPEGQLWETSMRLRPLNNCSRVRRAIEDRSLFVISPDHPIEAGFLCDDNPKIMRTFERGRAQGRRVLAGKSFQQFFEVA
jgi:hypothetical protein